jgi:FKBP-type peptidyl-prolyl cis-trans isomerase
MISVIRTSVLLAAVACSVACTAKAPAEGEAKPAADAAKAAAKPGAGMADKQRYGTMIGMDIAKSLAPIKDEVDVAAMVQAIQAGFAGKPAKLTEAEAEQVKAEFSAIMQAKMTAKAAAEGQNNLKAGQAFLAENGKKPGVRTTASGLQYQVLRQGSGPTPQKTDKVRVTYRGTLLDGTEFDSTAKHGGEPVEFMLAQVIPGWSEGVALMPVNSKYRFWIPSNLAYGPNGQDPIGPNSTLVFDVELLGIVK